MLTADADVIQRQTHKMLREFVNQLDQREETIIRYRFGLDGGGEKTLEEVGQHFGVTRERIRQIQNGAMLKLRRWIEKREAEMDPELTALTVAGRGRDQPARAAQRMFRPMSRQVRALE